MIIAPGKIIGNSSLEADLCIIGSGPAGITLALELKDTGLKIIILTGGSATETIENQDLHKGMAAPNSSHEPLEENRRRAFGGASLAWGGRCIPFDPIDFEKREWMPFSGWPVTYKELEPHFARAIQICKAGTFNFDARTALPGNGKSEIIKGLDNEDIVSHKMERWGPPVKFATDYYNELRDSPNISVLLDAHLLYINTENRKETVSSLTAQVEQKRITIKATTYVLASGGIENPRLLLASRNKFHPNGIGNDNDVVGRYYMAHLFGTYAAVSPTDRKSMIYNFEKDKEGVYCRRRWWITEKAQMQKRIGNIIFFLAQSEHHDGHRDALFSLNFIRWNTLSILRKRSIADVRQHWASEKSAMKEHFNVVLKEGWTIIPRLVKFAKKKIYKRGVPIVLPPADTKKLGLYYQSEQAPNPESRITISETEFDAFGIPRVVVKVAFTEIDKRTVLEAHQLFVDRFTKIGGGKIEYSADELEQFIEKRMVHFNSAAHHLGTTRISTDPKYGVVDQNCKVHGMDNLFIMGASTFPTGGHANPTLTIVAMVLRLAQYLKSNLK